MAELHICVDCGKHFKPPSYLRYATRCYNCYVRWKDYCDAYNPAMNAPPPWPGTQHDHGLLLMRRKLLNLCHPDKHDNSQLSTEVTQWLNSLPK